MPNIKISKIKTRRGTDEQLKTTALDQGELVSTIDTKRLYIGNGTGYGGFVVGNKINYPMINHASLTTLISELGDIAYANNKYYQLTASDYTNIASWGDVSTKIDPDLFHYTSSNKITLNDDSILASHIKASTASSGVKIENGFLQSDYDTSKLEINSNKLSLKAGGINHREINSNSFTGGLSGGSGVPIVINYDPTTFNIIGEKLSLKTNIIGKEHIKTDTLSSGLIGGAGETIRLNVDHSQFRFNSDTSKLELAKTGLSAEKYNQLASVSTDPYGRVINNQPAISDVLVGDSSLSSYNINSPLSSIFDGTINGNNTGLSLTYFTGLSSNGTSSVVITLSSAGFILFDEPSVARSGQAVGRFAIPIFSY
jgi:hypothetical protein